MSIIAQLASADSAQWIRKNALERLSGRAKYCAMNSWQYLIHADRISEIAPTVSFFCATHAVEEAVAAFVWSAKVHGYKDVANSVNVKDHRHKSVVVEFARMVADDAGREKMSFTLHPEKDDLFARIDRGEEPEIYHLNLGLISYNPDGEDTAADRAFNAFLSNFPDDKMMVKAINDRAEFRNKAIYAGKNGTPNMSTEALELQLKQHSVIAIGLIWAAMDMSRHDGQRAAFVVQALGAVKRISDKL